MNYPGKYDDVANCIWDIYTDSDKVKQYFETKRKCAENYPKL